MEILKAHQDRVTALQDAMERLDSLHESLFSLWEKIVHLQKPRGTPHEVQRLSELHAETRRIAGEIIALRVETFGSLRHASELELRSQVESLLTPEVGEESGENQEIEVAA